MDLSKRIYYLVLENLPTFAVLSSASFNFAFNPAASLSNFSCNATIKYPYYDMNHGIMDRQLKYI